MQSVRRRIVALTIAACLLCPGAPALADDVPPLILGVHPYLPYSHLQVRFAPLARYISRKLGVQVNVRVGRDYEEHIRTTGTDQLDIAYLGPVSYVRLTQRYGAKPLLARLERDGKPQLTGDIIVSTRSPIRSLAELRGKVFAFGDPQSTMSSIVPKAQLAAAGIDTGDLAYFEYFQGHNNVALAVLTGQADAGAVKREVFEQFEPMGLRSLDRLPGVSEHLFVARGNLTDAQIEQLRDILLNAHRERDGLRALQSIHDKATRLTPVDDADYTNLRQMLERLPAAIDED